MKLYTLAILLLMVYSCSPKPFRQIVQLATEYDDNNNGVFENEDVILDHMHLIEDEAGIFYLTNKTSQNLIVDLSKSHMIINDQAISYRVFYDAIPKEICIPPGSYKRFEGFENIALGIRNEDLELYPRDSSVISFSYQDSPMKFRHIINYRVDGRTTEKYITTEWWAKKVGNYNSRKKSNISKTDISLARYYVIVYPAAPSIYDF